MDQPGKTLIQQLVHFSEDPLVRRRVVFLDDYDIEVKSYLEVLASSDLRPVRGVNRSVTVHDSCVYARYEGVIEQPRELLRRAGFEVREPRESRNQTQCCGGPVESLFPKVAHRIGEKRVQQLKEANGDVVVTMCPICLATLRGVSEGELEMDDISEVLVEACCPGEGLPAGGDDAGGG